MKWIIVEQGWKQNAQLRWCKQLQRDSGEDLLLKASERKVLLGWKDLRVGNMDIRKHPKNSLIHGLDTTRLDKYYMSLWITESLPKGHHLFLPDIWRQHCKYWAWTSSAVRNIWHESPEQRQTVHLWSSGGHTSASQTWNDFQMKLIHSGHGRVAVVTSHGTSWVYSLWPFVFAMENNTGESNCLQMILKSLHLDTWLIRIEMALISISGI